MRPSLDVWRGIVTGACLGLLWWGVMCAAGAILVGVL